MAVGLPKGPSYLEHSPHPIIFFTVLPSKQPQKGSINLFKIARLSLLLFRLSLPRILLLFLLMSGGSVQPWSRLFLLSVPWKCDLEGQVGAMLHLLQMGPSRMLTIILLQFQCFRQLPLLKLSSLLSFFFSSAGPQPPNTVTSSSGPPSRITPLFNGIRLSRLYQRSAPTPPSPTKFVSSFRPLCNSSLHTFSSSSR